MTLPMAAHAQWLATPVNNAFNNVNNWTGGVVNGTYNQASTITTIAVAVNQQITGGNIVFDGAATPSFILGTAANVGNFSQFSGGQISMNVGLTANQTINAGLSQFGSTVGNKANVFNMNAVGVTLTVNGDFNNVNGTGIFTAGISNYFNLGGTGGIGIFNGIISNGKTAAGAAVDGNLIMKKTGSATYTINGANTYTGGTEVSSGNSGTLVLGNKSALGTGAIRVINGSGTSGNGFASNTALTGANAIANTVNFVSGFGASSTSNYTFVAGSNQATLTAGATPNVGDVITGSSLDYLPQYTRVTAVSGSTITFDNNAAKAGTGIAATNNPYNASGAGTFSVSGSNALEFAGTMNLTTTQSNLAAATQTFNILNTADTTFSGVLQQQGGVASLTKTGAGKLILTAANTYTGNTSITGGTLQLGAGGTTGSLNTTGAVSVGTGANLTFNRSNVVVQGTDFSGAAITGLGSLTQAGSSSVILTANNAVTGGVTINSGATLQIGNNSTTGRTGASGSFVNNGIFIISRTNNAVQGTDFSSAPISGIGSIISDSIGNTYARNGLTSANSYSGTTTIRNGYLDVGANSVLSGTDGPLGNSTSAIVLGDAGTVATTYGGGGPNAVLIVQGANNVTPQNFTISRDIDSSTTANVAGRNGVAYGNNNVGATGTLTVSGAWSLASGSARSNGAWAQQAGQTVDLTGVISGGNSATRFRVNDFGQGVGTVRLSNAGNSYAGDTSVVAGTLLIGGNAAAAGNGVLGTGTILRVGESGNATPNPTALIDGAFTVAKTVSLEDNATTTSTWTLGGSQAVVSTFSGNVNTISSVNSRTLNLSQVAGGTVNFTGVIGANANATGATSVGKIGGGTVILSNTNTYDGSTTVSNGTLLTNGSLASAVTVNGGTFGGTGLTTGAINVNAGGTLSPGASIESLGAGNITIDGGTMLYELNTNTSTADLLYGSVAGTTLSLLNSATLSLSDLGSGAALAPSTKFTLIAYNGTWNNGTFAGYADDSQFSFAGNTWLINYNDTTAGSNFLSDANQFGSQFVTITSVPETSGSVLILLGLSMLTIIRRGKRA